MNVMGSEKEVKLASSALTWNTHTHTHTHIQSWRVSVENTFLLMRITVTRTFHLMA